MNVDKVVKEALSRSFVLIELTRFSQNEKSEEKENFEIHDFSALLIRK